MLWVSIIIQTATTQTTSRPQSAIFYQLPILASQLFFTLVLPVFFINVGEIIRKHGDLTEERATTHGVEEDPNFTSSIGSEIELGTAELFWKFVVIPSSCPGVFRLPPEIIQECNQCCLVYIFYIMYHFICHVHNTQRISYRNELRCIDKEILFSLSGPPGHDGFRGPQGNKGK